MGAGGDFAHGHQERAGQAGGLEFPWFADIEEDGRIGLPSLLCEGFGCNFGFQHGFKNTVKFRPVICWSMDEYT